MKLELTAPLATAALPLPPHRAEPPKADPEVQAFYNPARTALLASASLKLTEAAERIERLQSRIKALTAITAEHLLS